MSAKSVAPTPGELCMLAKEIFGVTDLASADVKTDVVLNSALMLWVRAERVVRRAPVEVRLLAAALKKAENEERRQRAELEAEDKTLLSFDQAAKIHLGHSSGRMLRQTLNALAADKSDRGWNHAGDILKRGSMKVWEAKQVAAIHLERKKRRGRKPSQAVSEK